jgi:plastocyanin
MTTIKRATLPVVAAALATLLAGCGGDDSSTTTGAPAATTVAADPATTAEATSAPDETIPPTDGTEETESSSGEFGTAVLADGEAPAERTISITADGFEPATLTIAVGDNVTFKDGDDGIYGVIVGDLDGVTVTGGLIETFEFPEPGTYPVEEDISGATATIVVED